MVIIVHLSLHNNHNPDGIITTYSHLVVLWEYAGNNHMIMLMMILMIIMLRWERVRALASV